MDANFYKQYVDIYKFCLQEKVKMKKKVKTWKKFNSEFMIIIYTRPKVKVDLFTQWNTDMLFMQH